MLYACCHLRHGCQILGLTLWANRYMFFTLEVVGIVGCILHELPLLRA